jgi:Zn finger protein HypA/HybF involved in hydrogenase expression
MIAGAWLVILIVALIAVVWIVLHNNRRTFLCPDCEAMYDPTKDDGRCPTCGT